MIAIREKGLPPPPGFNREHVLIRSDLRHMPREAESTVTSLSEPFTACVPCHRSVAYFPNMHWMNSTNVNDKLGA